MEVIIPSRFCYSFHYSVERYCTCFTGHYSCAFRRDELSVEHDVRVLFALLAMTFQWIVTLRLRRRDLVGSVVRLCSQSIWLSGLASGASFEAHGVSFRPFQRIEICSGMPHWGIFHPFIIPSQFGVQSHRSFTIYDIQSHHVTLSVRRSEPLL